MRRYLLRFSYIGTRYRGSQKHSNQDIADIDSIQGALESVMSKLFRTGTEAFPQLFLAGRTDAGVHALNAAAHMNITHEPHISSFDTDNFLRMMNRGLINCGHTIRIHSCQEVSTNFHARHSAKSRTYLYRFLVPKCFNDHRIPIIEADQTLHFHAGPKDFDIEKLKKAIKLFQGTKDFTTFCSRKIHNNKYQNSFKSCVKTLHVALEEAQPLMPFDAISNNFNYWNLTFTSKSFLYNQIRRIVGILLTRSINQITEEDIITMLQVPSHNNWPEGIRPAQPHGLYLLNVEYDEADINPICNSS